MTSAWRTSIICISAFLVVWFVLIGQRVIRTVADELQFARPFLETLLMPPAYDLPPHRLLSPAAKTLNLSQLQLTESDLVDLSRCPLIENLDLSYTPFQDAWLEPLTKVTSLRSLDLSNTYVSDDGVIFLTDHLKSIEKLGLTSDRNLSDRSLVALAALKSLKSLNLSHNYFISDLTLKQALKSPDAFHSLQSINLLFCDVSDRGVDSLASLPNLQSLNLAYTKITDGALTHISRIKRLKALSLEHTEITGATLRELSSLPELESLDLESVSLSNEGLKAIGALTQLKSLILNHPYNKQLTCDAVTAPLCNFKNLKALDLSYCQVSNAGLKNLQSLSDLQDLDIRGTFVTDYGMKSVALLKSLKKLNVSSLQRQPGEPKNNQPVGITDVGLTDLQPLKRLQELSACDSLVTDAGLSTIADFSAMKVLDLSGTSVSDAGLAKLKNLRNLERLKLKDTQVTGSSFKDLAALTSLKDLDLSETKVQDRYLADLKLPKLERLDLTRTQVTGKSFKDMAALTSLKDLDLYGAKVEDRYLSDLQYLPALEKLSLGDNRGLTDGSPAHLRNCRKLRELHLSTTFVSKDAALELQQYLPACRIEGGVTQSD